MRIPITMCHDLRGNDKEHPLSGEHFDELMSIAARMGFTSINYNDLDAWRNRGGNLPKRPIMFDFDHAVLSMVEVDRIMKNYGFCGTLFVNTGPVLGLPHKDDVPYMDWEQIGKLMTGGWLIGAHTVTHPNLSKLFVDDPSGDQLRKELDDCNAMLEKRLGVRPKDFAYTATSFSTVAEAEVRKRYRFGRLWIIKPVYEVDGKEVRFAELVGVAGADEADGGPPMAARYVTREFPAYRLPSMEIQGIIHHPDAFRRYLEGALED